MSGARPESSEVKAQIRVEASRLEHGFLLKRKRRSSEEDVEEAIEGHKRAKSGEVSNGSPSEPKKKNHILYEQPLYRVLFLCRQIV